MRKGHTNNPNGRPKGTPNKATKKVKNVLQQVFEEEYTPEKIRAYIQGLDDTDKLRFLVQLLPYLAPKQRPEEPEEVLAPDFNRIDLSSLTDTDLRTLQAIQEKYELSAGKEIKEIRRIIVDPRTGEEKDLPTL